MAITIDQAPVTSGTPAYNPNIWVVDSNNKTQDNFKYVLDLYVQGESSYKRLKQSPHPDYGNAVFDLKGIIQNYVSYNFAWDGSSNTIGTYAAANMPKQYTVKFGEEYGASSGTTVYANLTSSSGLVWNASLTYNDFVNYNFNNYNPDNNTSAKFFTTRPRHEIDINGNVTYAPTINYRQANWLYFNNYNNQCGRVRVITYYSKNTSDVQASYQINFQPTYSDFKDSFIRIAAGYNMTYINNIYTSSTPPSLVSGIQMFSIQAYPSVGGANSEIMYFYYNHDGVCSVNPVWTLYFLNPLGGFDYMTFTGAPTTKKNIERKFYKRNLGTQTADSFTYSTSDFGRVPYNTTIKEELKLVSDWVTEDEHAWLFDLMSSPVVFGVKDYDYTNIYALSVKSVDYTEKTDAKDMLYNIEVLAEYSHTNTRQSW